jgi:hypothetical protein
MMGASTAVAAIAIALLLPMPLRLVGVAGAVLAAWFRPAAALPLALLAGRQGLAALAAHRRRQTLARQFEDLLLLLAVGGLDGYGVYGALLLLPADTLPAPLDGLIAAFQAEARRGTDPQTLLANLRRSLASPAADRLLDTVERERLFGVPIGETLMRQLDLLRAEGRERLRRRGKALPVAFTVSAGLLFLDLGLLTLYPTAAALLHSVGLR